MQKAVSARDLAFRAPPSGEDGAEFLALLRTMRRGWATILACTAVALAIGWYQAYRLSVPLYTATVQMALQVRAAPVVDLDAVITGVSGDEASMNTEMATIRSRALISRLVDEMRLVDDPEFNPALASSAGAARMFQRLPILFGGARAGPQLTPDEARSATVTLVRDAIVTGSSRGTYVFSISATTRDPLKSAEMANTLARLYREDQVRIKVEATDGAAQWLSARVGELQRELEERQNAINDLRSRRTLPSSAGLAALNSRATELRQSLELAQSAVIRLEDRAKALLDARFGTLADRADLAADSQLATLAATGDTDRFERRFEQVVLQNRAELDRARDQAARLQAAVAELGRQFEVQSSELLALQQLERETEATRILYETFLTRLKETTVQQGVHQPDSRILSEATPGRQVAPRTSMILGIALLLGLSGGTGLVLLREMTNATVRSAAELESLTGLPVLGQIPRLPVGNGAGISLYFSQKPSSPAAEAVRNLRTSVLLSDVDQPPKVILSTSSIPGEGKTTHAVALAQNLAAMGRRVALVEGDIRLRCFSAIFPEAAGRPGLLAVLSGEVPLAEAMHRPAFAPLDVLMAEPSGAIAADVFSSDRFHDLVGALRDAYDQVVIDTPPVLVVPDARVIAQEADAVLYTVRWDSTTRAQVEEGLKQFRSVNVRVSGLVLARIDPAGMRRYGHGGDYGAYSAYGRRYYEA